MKQALAALALATVVLAACKGKDADPGAGTGGTGAAGSGAGAGPSAPPPPPPAPTPPTMTPELLFAEGPTAFLQMIRGIVLVDGDDVQHVCRVELAKRMVRLGTIAEQAKALQADPASRGSTTCAPHGAYATCTFRQPAPDPSRPDAAATWVFVGEAGNPVLHAVLLGTAAGRVDAFEADLARAWTPCKRPSEE